MLVVIIIIGSNSDTFSLTPLPQILLYIWLVMFLKCIAAILPRYENSLFCIFSISQSLFPVKLQVLASFILQSFSFFEIHSQLLLYLSIIAYWSFLELSSVNENSSNQQIELSFCFLLAFLLIGPQRRVADLGVTENGLDKL